MNRNPVVSGCLVLLVIIAFLAVCVIFTFGVLPGWGASVALPVIMVPGEPYDPTLPVESFRWTNTLTAMVLATLAVLAFAFFAWRSSKGWTRQVPARFQSWVELLGGFIYNFSKQMAGDNARVIFPLVATIFVFLLAVNWMKLLPGVESVGVLHCAEEGFSGYPAIAIGDGAYQLFVDQPLYAGEPSSEEDYHHCKDWKADGSPKPTYDVKHEVAEGLRTAEEEAVAALTATGAPQEEIDARIRELRLEATEELYPHPFFALSADQIERGAIPYNFVITPYVRGGSTDLNLTIGLALISVVAIQVFGVMALGPGYFLKFVNLTALGSLGKKPLGAIDFIVGLIEIISEIGKIISLAFRLFGNMFAGGILLAVMSFLVAAFLPMIFIGLELIVTTIQALVFAVLTLVFSAQAMTAHHGDDHDEHGHGEHDETGAAAAAHS